jgi:hypothetical protein
MPQLRGDYLEQAVWAELYHLFAKPGPTLRAIDEQVSAQYGPEWRIGQEREQVETAIAGVAESRMEYHRQRARGKLTESEYDRLLSETGEQEAPLSSPLSRTRSELAASRQRRRAILAVLVNPKW